MSTKSTLRYGPKHHLYEEAFDRDAVYLEIGETEFCATDKGITVRIPLAIWEHVRDATIAAFDLVDLSDAELVDRVKQRWDARQKLIAESTNDVFGAAIGGAIWGRGTPEEQFVRGLEWNRGERQWQRKLRAEIEELRRPPENP